MHTIIIYLSIRYILALLGATALIVKFIIPKNAININEVWPTKRDCVLANISSINLIVKIIVFIIVLGIFIAEIPLFRDIPNIISQDYSTANIEAIGWSIDDNKYRIKRRTIAVKNIDVGNEMMITVYYSSINKGDRFRILYMPHTKWAYITSKL